MSAYSVPIVFLDPDSVASLNLLIRKHIVDKPSYSVDAKLVVRHKSAIPRQRTSKVSHPRDFGGLPWELRVGNCIILVEINGPLY
jgi:hypothetical protein